MAAMQLKKILLRHRTAFIFTLYLILLLFIECSCKYHCGIGKSLMNPFTQQLLPILAVAGIGFVLPGKWVQIYCSVVSTAGTLITAASLYSFGVFRLPLTGDIFMVLSASSPGEIREFTRVFTNWKWFLLVAFFLLINGVMLCLYRQKKMPFAHSGWILAAILILPALLNGGRLIAKGEPEELYDRNTFSRLAAGYFIYQEKMGLIADMMTTPELPQGIRRLNPDKMIGVLVIGESASRRHWGLYGYFRNTTPEMEKIRPELLIFDDVISPYAHTVESCRMTLSTADWDTPEDLRYTAFQVLEEAGFNVIYLSNQYRWGKYDGPVNLLFSSSDERYYFRSQTGGAPDGVMLPKLFKEIDEAVKPTLLVVHLMGSHTDYSHRYPEEFTFWKQLSAENQQLPPEVAANVNAYDNSIAYTDFLLGQIADKLSREKYPAYLMYFSDHGDTPDTKGGRSGNSEYPGCYEIPMIFYGNSAYCRYFPEFIKNARSNQSKASGGDYLDNSIISAAQVTFDGFEHGKDLFSPQYRAPQLRTLGEGRKIYTKGMPDPKKR